MLVRRRGWRREAAPGGSQRPSVVFRLRVTNFVEVEERGKKNSEDCNGDGDLLVLPARKVWQRRLSLVDLDVTLLKQRLSIQGE